MDELNRAIADIRNKGLYWAVQPFIDVRYCLAGLSLEMCCWDPANWVEPEGFNPLEDYNAPEYLLPEGYGVLGISDYGWIVDNESLKDSTGNPAGTIYTVHPRGADSPKVTWRLHWNRNAGKPFNPSQPKVLTRINGATRYQTMNGLVDLMSAGKTASLLWPLRLTILMPSLRLRWLAAMIQLLFC